MATGHFYGTISLVQQILLLEIRRQAAHLVFGVLFATLIFMSWIDIWFLSALTLTCGALMFYWKVGQKKGVLFEKILNFLERNENMIGLPGKGLFFFLLGMTLVVILFPLNIALASILILSIGDSISHLYGRFLGKIKIPFYPRKNVEGHILAIFFSAAAAMIFLPVIPALIAATLAMLAEIPCGRNDLISIDDNLIIPLVAGGSLWLMNIFWPFL